MGFFLYLVFMALTYLRPIEAFAPELVVYRPMLVLAILVFAVGLMRSLSSREIASSRQALALVFGFSASILLSTAATGWLGGVPTAAIDFAPSVLIFLTTVMLVVDIGRLRATCAVIAMSMTILALASTLAYHTGFLAETLVVWQYTSAEDAVSEAAEENVVPAHDTSGEKLWRVRSLGFLSDPNDFGQAIVVALPMIFMLYRRGSLLRNLLVVLAPCSIMLYAIYLTHSRGALLGLASLLFFAIKRHLGAVKTGVLMALLGTAAMVVGFTGGRAYTANEESAGGRVDAWSEGLNMFLTHPLFGVGYHRFTEYHSHTAHNSFVICFAETGLLGYVLWLGLIVVVFALVSRAIELSPPGSEAGRWAASLRSSMVGFFTCAFFLSRAYEPQLFILLSLALGAWFSARQALAQPAVDKLFAPVRWRLPSVAIAFASILLIYIIIVIKNALVGRSI